MPKRRYRRGRRGYSRNLRSQVYRNKKAIQRINNDVEIKAFDTSASTAYSASGTIIDISDPAQGDGSNERVGDVIKPTSLRFRGTFKMHGSATDTMVRIVLYQWKSGVSAATTDVLEAAEIDSPKNWDKRMQSKILLDKTVILNANQPETIRNYRIKLPKNYKVSFAAGSTTYLTGGLYLLILSDEATNTPTVDWFTRCVYKDV